MAKIILFLGLCYLAYAQDIRDSPCRTSAGQLIEDDCPRACITITRESSPCPVCMETPKCKAAMDDDCLPDDPQRSCSDSQICVATGVAGRYNCTDRPGEGQECPTREDLDDFIERIERSGLEVDIAARDGINQLSDIVVPCLQGLICRREALDRSVCVVETGPCPEARMRDSLLMCDDRGLFRPRQCRKVDGSRTYQCRCVEPLTGTLIRDTQVEVENLDAVPDCDDRVLDRCEYRSSAGTDFSVRSGERFINLMTCSLCVCRDGEGTLCERLPEGSCDEFNPTPGPDRDCRVRGRTVPNGDSVAVDCNRCACKNGVVVCTKRDCEEDEEEGDEDDPMNRDCRACGAMRAAPVCGSDGRTYPSRCFAVTCRGLNADDLTPGPCSRRDVCRENPCGDGEVCLRNGGVTCLSTGGCRPDRLRRCVDLTTLRCKRREGDEEDEEEPTSDGDELPSEDSTSDDSDEEDDADAVCGSNGRTFSSVCTFIQTSADLELAYAGSCNRTECSSGQVCGTDGETYSNICELRTKSANARVDHRGECDEETDEMVDNRCMRLRRSGRCAAHANCRSRVRPGDGCCPICGGAVTIGVDQDALDEYVRLNRLVDTVDGFFKTLISDRFISEDVLRICRVAASLLRTGDLHIAFESPENSDGMACAMVARRIADKINNPPTATTTTTANPQVLQLVTVAQTSPLVDEDGNIPMAAGGAVPIASFSLAVMLIPMLALLM